MATKSTYGYKGIPLPVGSVLYHSSTQLPFSFLVCDGSSLLKSEYTNLFSVLGDGFGSVDAEHFNLPDLITYQYLQGGNAYNPVPNQSIISFPPSLVLGATIPSLSQANFAYQSWNLTADINGGVWFNNGQTTVAVQLTSTDGIKANSSDVSSYSGTVTGGTIGYTNGGQETIDPIQTAGEIEPVFLSFLPIIKAFAGFIPPYYENLPVAVGNPFIVTPASTTFYPPNPESIYLLDPALSGFIF